MRFDHNGRGATRAGKNCFLLRVACILAGTCSLWCGIWGTVVHAQEAISAAPKLDSQNPGDNSRDANCGIIYLGIVGALETSGYKGSGVVQIRDILRGPAYPDVCAKTFSPYVWTAGLHWLLKHFEADPKRQTDVERKRAPKVILVGHSTGGWAVLGVARKLRRKNIPVELIVLVDSVGITDHTVPRNVKVAAIFHARDILILLTTKSLRLEDPSRTKIIANVLVRGAGHESVTRAPRIRELVMSTVESLRAAPESPPGRDARWQP